MQVRKELQLFIDVRVYKTTLKDRLSDHPETDPLFYSLFENVYII